MSRLRVLVISFTDTRAEPRVQRQLRNLERRGILFAGASFSPPRSHNEAVDFIALHDSLSQVPRQLLDERNGTRHRFVGEALFEVLSTCKRHTRRLVWFVGSGAYGLLPITKSLLGASSLGKKVSRQWFRPGWQKTSPYPQKIRVQVGLVDFKPNLVVFRDCFTFKLAFNLAEEYGARTLFDVHEHAITQYSKQPGWLEFIAPTIRDIEEDAVRKSHEIVTVGEEIRTLLGEQYRQMSKTYVVRSVSEFDEQPFRPSSYPLKLLYSEAISRERGLVERVNSMVSIQDHFTFTIKGPVGDSKFERRLRKRVEEVHLSQIVQLEEPCGYEEIVQHANNYDVGIFVQPNTSKHKLYTLPNKFFSYIAAGLALCVSDYPELARISKEWEFAIFVDDCSPESISAALK